MIDKNEVRRRENEAFSGPIKHRLSEMLPRWEIECYPEGRNNMVRYKISSIDPPVVYSFSIPRRFVYMHSGQGMEFLQEFASMFRAEMHEARLLLDQAHQESGHNFVAEWTDESVRLSIQEPPPQRPHFAVLALDFWRDLAGPLDVVQAAVPQEGLEIMALGSMFNRQSSDSIWPVFISGNDRIELMDLTKRVQPSILVHKIARGLSGWCVNYSATVSILRFRARTTRNNHMYDYCMEIPPEYLDQEVYPYRLSALCDSFVRWCEAMFASEAVRTYQSNNLTADGCEFVKVVQAGEVLRGANNHYFVAPTVVPEVMFDGQNVTVEAAVTYDDSGVECTFIPFGYQDVSDDTIRVNGVALNGETVIGMRHQDGVLTDRITLHPGNPEQGPVVERWVECHHEFDHDLLDSVGLTAEYLSQNYSVQKRCSMLIDEFRDNDWSKKAQSHAAECLVNLLANNPDKALESDLVRTLAFAIDPLSSEAVAMYCTDNSMEKPFKYGDKWVAKDRNPKPLFENGKYVGDYTLDMPVHLEKGTIERHLLEKARNLLEAIE